MLRWLRLLTRVASLAARPRSRLVPSSRWSSNTGISTDHPDRPPTRLPAGRAWACAEDGDVEALVQALDSGCSTEEANAVSWQCYPYRILLLTSPRVFCSLA